MVPDGDAVTDWDGLSVIVRLIERVLLGLLVHDVDCDCVSDFVNVGVRV